MNNHFGSFLAVCLLFFSPEPLIYAQGNFQEGSLKIPYYHPPVFQRGNKLSQPLDDDDPAVQRFLDFFSKHTQHKLPNLRKADVIPFPSQHYDRADWGLGVPGRFVDYTENTLNTFVTSDNCRKCHDATETSKSQQPRMTIRAANDPSLLANWSEFGEWSVSLMALSARDPVFHAQVETERDQHPGVPPTVIDNICYSCHGAMGQKQITKDAVDGKNMFNHYMIYSTPDNFHPTKYPYNISEAATQFSHIGALARDGLSCEVCHHIGSGRDFDPKTDDWSEFYGARNDVYNTRETSGAHPEPGGFDYPFTSNFKYNLKSLIVPDDGVANTEEPMHLLGMAGAQKVNYIKRSELCGTCHVVIVPKIPPGYKKGIPPIYEPPGNPHPGAVYSGDPFTDPLLNLAYEQTTYFEYLNSSYPLEGIECQTCHMPGIKPPEEQVSSIGPAWYSPNVTHRNDAGKTVRGTPDRTYTRHRLLGINLFVSEMFQQFPDTLGIANPLHDPETPTNVASNLLNAEQSIVQHATNGPFGPTVGIAIVDGPTMADGNLTATVEVVSNAGHKFPTGAGFRRGFIEFQVLDENGNVIWVSGSTNEFGVILGSNKEPLPSEFAIKPNELQQHWQEINSADQVQIYEVSTKGFDGNLTSQTLSLFENVKDNRLMPKGWNPQAKGKQRGLELAIIAKVTGAIGYAEQDDFYTDPSKTGRDRVVYSIPADAVPGARAVKAIMHYQTIPPNFLKARFDDGYGPQDRAEGVGFGSATQRLIYMTSHLNTNLKALKSSTAARFNVIENWTMTLSVASKMID